MSNKIITISREFGSGGRTIGKETAAKLGISCYDYELIEKVAKESGFVKEYIAEKGEYTQHGGWLANVFSERGFQTAWNGAVSATIISPWTVVSLALTSARISL